MTLIASWEVDGAPIFVGDLLLSSKVKRPVPVFAPLHHGVQDDGQPKACHVAGVSQKLVLVHDHLCVAWAGSEVHARSFIKSLRRHVERRTAIPYEAIQEFFRGYPREDVVGHLELIIYCWHGNGWGFWSNVATFDLGDFSKIRIAGTGTPHFYKHIEQLSATEVIGTAGAYQTAASRGLAYLAMSSLDQIVEATGIADGWGGGFELVTFDGSRFQKQDRILWLRWRFEDIQGGLLARLSPILMYQYYNGRNVYFWIDEGLVGKPDHHHVISAPDDENSEDTLGQIPEHMGPASTICLFQVVSGGQVSRGVFCDNVKPGDEPNTFIDRANGRVGLGIRPAFFERFFDTMKLSNRVCAIELWGTTSPWPSNGIIQRS